MLMPPKIVADMLNDAPIEYLFGWMNTVWLMPVCLVLILTQQKLDWYTHGEEQNMDNLGQQGPAMKNQADGSHIC